MENPLQTLVWDGRRRRDWFWSWGRGGGLYHKKGIKNMYERDIISQKRKIIQMVYESKREAHLSPAMSILEILNVLLREIMYVENGDLDHCDSDRLVISKGHASLALYALYEHLGYISKNDFYSFQKRNSKYGVHPDRHKVLGVSVSTGSLGHGLPNAVGIAYAWKLQKRKNRIYVIVGDGELNEGSNWESMIFASRFGLINICCIVDNNGSFDNMPQLDEKFRAFGWETTVMDGHDEDQIRKALSKRPKAPYAIIANTVKGKGIGIMEKDHAGWHHKGISEEDYQNIMGDLECYE
ncbi:transketolase [Clostridiaceae bacterium]|nr:transketolase [Clostridiaceae bacterium]